MVICIVIYKFELNATPDGDIEPEFNVITSEFSEEHAGTPIESLITQDDLFSLLFNHSTGMGFKPKGETKNFFVGRLKETPIRVISYFRQEMDESQYLTISFFKLDEEAELFEPIIRQLAPVLDKIFQRLATGNLKDASFVEKVKKDFKREISFALFQIERLSRLDKVQKVALIFSNPERVRTLQILREGPVTRKTLQFELEKVKPNPNVDLVLSPFVELNLVRRDWAKGVRDPKSRLVRGEGEFIVLVKDVSLVRRPPAKIMEAMKGNKKIGSTYLAAVEKFYSSYDPFSSLDEEGRTLARFLLDPDVYDFLGLLSEKYFPRKKVPKVTSEFTTSENLIDELLAENIAIAIKDDEGTEWICLLSEITPLVVFPEYLVERIKERVSFVGSDVEETSVEAPITPEIARRALDLLELTYNEKIEW
ncbi:MAG: hypothetical protein Kow0069_12890 [Promethearchaeota archaeon]